MEENLHNEFFDELLRSKYQNQTAQPPKHLWDNIQRAIPGAPVSAKPWYLSKSFILALIVTAAMSMAAILLYNFYLKPRTNPINSWLEKNEILLNSPAREKKTTPKIILSNPSLKKTTHSIMKSSSVISPYGSKKFGEAEVPRKIIQNTSNQTQKTVTLLINNTIGLRQAYEQALLTKRIPTSVIKSISIIQHKGLFLPALSPAEIYTLRPPMKVNIIPQKLVKIAKRQKAHKKKRQSLPHPLSLEFYWMPEYSYRVLAQNPGYAKGAFNPSYFNSRDRYKFTYSYGLLLAYEVRPKLYFETGLSYYSYALTFKTESANLIKKDEYNMLIYTSSGSVNLNIVSSDSLSPNTLLKSSMSLSYISLPIMVKYYPFDNLFLNAGLSFEYNIVQSLNWDAENQKGDFRMTSGRVNGVGRFNISFIFGPGYEQKISKHISFSMNPSIRVHLMNLNPHNTVKSYPFTTGFRLSIKYVF